MHLGTNESVLRVYRHHWFPFFLNVIKLLLALAPFYFLLFIAAFDLSTKVTSIILTLVVLMSLFAFFYMSFIYWADRLVVTNFRIVYVNWELLHLSQEQEVEIKDIQDVKIRNKGIFSFIPFLDYGLLTIEMTGVSKLIFQLAPDPEGIKAFIYNIK